MYLDNFKRLIVPWKLSGYLSCASRSKSTDVRAAPA